MTMDNTEIINTYRAAKDKKAQLGILAELNTCSKTEIADILTEAGEKVVGQRMSPKDYLSRARHLDREITALLQARAEAKRRAEGLYRPMDRSSQPQVNDPHYHLDRLVELNEVIDSRVDALIDTKREIIGVIARVPDSRYRVLLTERYVNCRTWEEIAATMHYSLRRVTQLHGYALQEVLPFISRSVRDTL